MKAYEFPARVSSDGRLEGPEVLIGKLPRHKALRVIVFVPETDENDEESSWAELTRQQFLSGYAEADAIYDQLDE